MPKTITGLLGAIALLGACSVAPEADPAPEAHLQDDRPRVIINSDFPPLDVLAGAGCTGDDPANRCSDPDDVQSMVRLLLYSNELKIEALVASAGTFANIRAQAEHPRHAGPV